MLEGRPRTGVRSAIDEQDKHKNGKPVWGQSGQGQMASHALVSGDTLTAEYSKQAMLTMTT